MPLKYLNQLIKRRCTAFLISDFYHWSEDYRQTLSLSARRHDLVAIRTFDKGARELPRMGLLRLCDAETGEERWVDTASSRVARHYAEEVRKQEETFRSHCLRSGVDHIEIATDGDYVPELIKLFGRRS